MLRVEQNAAENTLRAYAKDLRHAGEFLETRQKHLSDAARADLESYIADMRASGLAASTAARRLSALRRFYGFLAGEGWRGDDPTRAIDSPKLRRPMPKYLTVEEITRMIATVDAAIMASNARARAGALRLKCLLEILYASGLRVSELLALPLAAMRDGERFVIVRGKGDKERLAPLNEAARAAIDDYLEIRHQFLEKGPSPWLFPSRGKSGRLTRARFAQLLKDLALRAGVAPSRVSPHVLRHAFATHLLAGGADLRSVQEMLGHADISTTEIYTHVLDAAKRKLVEEKHPLAGGD